MLYSFCGPSRSRMGMLIGHAIFGDGAAAAIIGPDIGSPERLLFRMVSAAQTVAPDSEDTVVGEFAESGTVYWFLKKMPFYIGSSLEKIMEEAFALLGISDWNSVSYAIHPGGRAMLDEVEEKLGLGAEKLRASRLVLSEYGNMWAPTVFFVLDEVWKMVKEEGKATTGDGLEWGVLMAFGPGLTVETIVLRSEVVA